MYLVYSMPSLAGLPCVFLIGIFLVDLYERIGTNLAYMAFFLALTRGVDVVTDFLMAGWSDNAKFKSGRRRPFMFTGAIPYAIFFVLLMTPPATNDGMTLAIWFGVFSILYGLCFTYTQIPYDAMGPELTDNYDDRSRVFFCCVVFDVTGMVLACALSTLFVGELYNQRCSTDSMAYTMDASSCSPDNSLDGILTTASCAVGESIQSFADYSDELDPFVFLECDYNSVVTLSPGTNMTYQLAREGCCIFECGSKCMLSVRRQAFFACGLIFGIYYAVTMMLAAGTIKERSNNHVTLNHTAKKNPPPVPAMMSTFRNVPFMTLLPCWICDAVGGAVYFALGLFYCRYVVQPEYTPGCPPTGSNDWFCDSTTLYTFALLSTLIVSFLFTPVWLCITAAIGKHKAWLLWSFITAITNILLLIPGKGEAGLTVFLLSLNGIPVGAKFLSDSILADIIDYDEFLTGTRKEATYTVFKSFLPKIASIAASVIPLAILNSIGHVQSKNGVIQQQPQNVVDYVRYTTAIPCFLLACISFALKFRFPLTGKDQVDEISIGIGAHLNGKSSTDPITGFEVKPPPKYTPEELEKVHVLDHFPGPDVIEDALDDMKGTYTHLVTLTTIQLALVTFFGLIWLVVAAVTFGYLEEKNSAITLFPVLSIVFFGVSITVFCFAVERFKAAKKLQTLLPDEGLLERVLIARTVLTNVRQDTINVVRESAVHQRVSLMLGKSPQVAPEAPEEGEKDEEKGGNDASSPSPSGSPPPEKAEEVAQTS